MARSVTRLSIARREARSPKAMWAIVARSAGRPVRGLATMGLQPYTAGKRVLNSAAVSMAKGATAASSSSAWSPVTTTRA